MRCPTCGVEIKPGARFCSGCGACGEPPAAPRNPLAFSKPQQNPPAAPVPQQPAATPVPQSPPSQPSPSIAPAPAASHPNTPSVSARQGIPPPMTPAGGAAPRGVPSPPPMLTPDKPQSELQAEPQPDSGTALAETEAQDHGPPRRKLPRRIIFAVNIGILVIVLLIIIQTVIYLLSGGGRFTHIAGVVTDDKHGFSLKFPKENWFRPKMTLPDAQETATFFRGARLPYTVTLRVFMHELNMRPPPTLSPEIVGYLDIFFTDLLQKKLVDYGHTYRNEARDVILGPDGEQGLRLRGKTTDTNNRAAPAYFYIYFNDKGAYILWFSLTGENPDSFLDEIQSMASSFKFTK